MPSNATPKRYRVQIKVSRRQGVFDPAARVIARTIDHLLESHEEGELDAFEVHKTYTLTLRALDATRAEAIARRLCEELLVEPTLEDHRIESLQEVIGEEEAPQG